MLAREYVRKQVSFSSIIAQMNTMAPPTKRRIERPVGVWVLTIFDGLFIGLVPIVVVLFLYGDLSNDMPFYGFVITLILGGTILAASILTFGGDNMARLVLLCAITVSSVVLIYNNITFMAASEEIGTNRLASFGNITRGLLWIGVNWWYFNRSATLKYYKQEMAQ